MPVHDASTPGNGTARFEDLREQVTQHDKRLSLLEQTMARIDERTAATADDVRAMRDEDQPHAARDRTSLRLQWVTIGLLVLTLLVRVWPVAQAAAIHH